MTKWEDLKNIKLNLDNLDTASLLKEFSVKDWTEIKEKLNEEIKANNQTAGALLALNIVLDLLIAGRRFV